MSLFLKTALFTLVAPATVGTFLPRYLARRAGDLPAGGWWPWLASAPLIVGGAIYLWCAWDFAAYGRGTPAPIDAPTRLVVRGLYKYVRNPMYIGVLLMIVGWALFFASTSLVTYAIGVAFAFHLFVLLYEEPALAHRFAKDYATYRRQVHRWTPHRPTTSKV